MEIARFLLNYGVDFLFMILVGWGTSTEQSTKTYAPDSTLHENIQATKALNLQIAPLDRVHLQRRTLVLSYFGGLQDWLEESSSAIAEQVPRLTDSWQRSVPAGTQHNTQQQEQLNSMPLGYWACKVEISCFPGYSVRPHSHLVHISLLDLVLSAPTPSRAKCIANISPWQHASIMYQQISTHWQSIFCKRLGTQSGIIDTGPGKVDCKFRIHQTKWQLMQINIWTQPRRPVAGWIGF